MTIKLLTVNGNILTMLPDDYFKKERGKLSNLSFLGW